jgi:hypothetical protein
MLAAVWVVIRSRGLMAVIFVMVMGRFAIQAVQPAVTLFVREMLGMRPDIASWPGWHFPPPAWRALLPRRSWDGGAMPSATDGCC